MFYFSSQVTLVISEAPGRHSQNCTGGERSASRVVHSHRGLRIRAAGPNLGKGKNPFLSAALLLQRGKTRASGAKNPSRLARREKPRTTPRPQPGTDALRGGCSLRCALVMPSSRTRRSDGLLPKLTGLDRL